MRKITTILIIALAFGITSCRENNQKISQKSVSDAKNSFAKINKVLVDQDRVLIENYIKRYKLDGMKESGTGLYYLIWGESAGDLIKTGNVVEYLYKISLLDGTPCYESEKGVPKKFKVGQGGVEYGLEQGVLLMKPGQKGKFILPPHLAYGLIGDNKKIPARSIIVYDVEMLNVYR